MSANTLRSSAMLSIAAVISGLLLSEARAAVYSQVFSATAVNTASGVASPLLNTVTSSGGTAYAVIQSTSSVSGNVTAYNGSFTPVMAPTAWASADPSGLAGAGIVGGVFRTVHSASNSVFEVNLGTGVSTQVVPTASISAVTGGTPSLVAFFETTASGDIYAYNAASGNRQIVKISSSNVVTQAVSQANYNTLFTSTGNVNGLGFGGSTIYLGGGASTATRYLAGWNTSTNTGSTILSNAQLLAFTGGTSISFGDIYAAPDGRVYFFESTSNAILSFNPANPAPTLATVYSSADLAAGPGTTNVGQLSWWNGGIAWSIGGTASTSGYFAAIPESSAAAFGGLSVVASSVIALVRRKRA